MADDKGIRDEKLERGETEQDDPTITRRVTRQDAGDEERAPEPVPSGGIVQQIWRRIQEERSRPKRVEINTRGQNNMDRSKAFLVLATAVVLIGFAFLALFSTSGAEKRAQERRTKPSLGRPESSVQQAATGSTVPLLSADQTGADQNGDQLSPDDILATSRRSQTPPQQQQQPPKSSDQFALSNVPTFNDPALDAYKRPTAVYTPPPPPLPPAAVPQPTNDSDGLKKSSLVFVRNTTSATVTNASLGSGTFQQAIIERRRPALLPTGSRLVARLQTAVSSAVKTPVIAVIEYNYERDGEIVIPAGTKAIGQLTQANQNGQVGLRFTTLQSEFSVSLHDSARP